MSLVSTEPWTLPQLVAAAAGVDPTLVPRMLFDGWATQLVDTDDVAVVTVELAHHVEDAYDVEWLTEIPRGGRLPTEGQVWWTEATAPWGPAGASGVAIVRALGATLGARVVVSEGR